MNKTAILAVIGLFAAGATLLGLNVVRRSKKERPIVSDSLDNQLFVLKVLKSSQSEVGKFLHCAPVEPDVGGLEPQVYKDVTVLDYNLSATPSHFIEINNEIYPWSSAVDAKSLAANGTNKTYLRCKKSTTEGGSLLELVGEFSVTSEFATVHEEGVSFESGEQNFLVIGKAPIADYSQVTAPIQVKVKECEKSFILFDSNIFQIEQRDLKFLDLPDDQSPTWSKFNKHSSADAPKVKLTKVAVDSNKYQLQLEDAKASSPSYLVPQKGGKFRLDTPNWFSWIRRKIFTTTFVIEQVSLFEPGDWKILKTQLL